ncbi:MAG TPA: M13 family metallopeptidase, partial [Chthoniobacterales bacterium]
MLKTSVLLLASLCCAVTLRAQSEPQKNEKALGSATPAPQVHDAGKPPADKVPPTSQTQESSSGETAKKVEKNPPALDVKNMDTSVQPSQDFYEYANGTWIKNNPIPPEFSRWGSFNELAEKNNAALHEIAEKAAQDSAKLKSADKIEQAAAAEVQKVGDYYASGMDEKSIDAARTKPLDEEFKRIDALKDKNDVLKEVAHLHGMGINAFFNFTSGQDEKNSTMVIGQLYQGGLGLPDRDYYTKDDEQSKKLRDAYVQHVAKMLTLIGEKQDVAAQQAQKVMAFETALATPQRTRVELRDPQKNYNKMSQADLQKLMPDWQWNTYFSDVKLTTPGDINVGQPDFFKAANDVFAKTSLDDWKTYLRWHLIHGAAAELSNDFVNENFAFYDQTLRGSQQIKPRWKRVVANTDEALGEAMGKLYVAEYFPPQAKERALELVHNLEEALSDRIKSLDWMDEPTKQEALKKLAAFTVKIGYPDKWRDYSTLKIDRGPFVLNAARAAAFETDRELKKIGKPVDRSEWGMTPPTVNAYYNPTMNEIVFPAGILQSPFFNANADDAVNYGGIGAVIGHEMTHG